MTGLILNRAEFLTLMSAVEAQGVVGLNLMELVPSDPEQFQALVTQGLQSLQERGAASLVDEVNVLDPDLLSMAVLVAHPEVAVITTRLTPDVGQQLFLHYLAGDVVLEQTLPSETEHRWALVPDRPALAERLLGILPVQATAPTTPVKATISQEALAAVQQSFEAGNGDEARTKLSEQGVAGAAAETVLEALTTPEFAGQVAVLRCEGNEIVAGRNVMVIQGAKSALLLKPSATTEAALDLTATDEAGLRTLLSTWLTELSAQPA